MRLPSLSTGTLHLSERQHDTFEMARQHGTAVVRAVTRTLAERAATSSCAANDDSGVCQKPTGTQTLPIVLGAAIPIGVAVIVLIFLHQRYIRKQRHEDANDPHKSLDFGIDAAPQFSRPRRGKGKPEMTATDMNMGPPRPQRPRGLSMDMDLGSPYLLPAAVQGSRESLHSMSRSMRDEHDPYRPVTLLRPSQEHSRSPHPFNDKGSMYSASTAQTSDNSTLLGNAQRMSQSFPKRGSSTTPDDTSYRQMHSSTKGKPTSRLASFGAPEGALDNVSENEQYEQAPRSLPASKEPEVFIEQLPPTLHPEPSLPPQMDGHPAARSTDQSRPPRKSSMAASRSQQTPSISSANATGDRHMSESSFYAEDAPPPPAPPATYQQPPLIEEPSAYYEPDEEQYDIHPDMIYTGRFSIDHSAPSQQPYPQENRLSTMGLRPLPPDHPEENPEQRANRIRSFYKEYFDDSRPNPAHSQYYADQSHYHAGSGYDPETGDYYQPWEAPYAQPVGRRAMTPPPRGPPRFGSPAHERHFSTLSGGRGPRGRSAQRPPPIPKKRLPPPKALQGLPTPAKLGSDIHIMNPIDFAPPASFREVQNGRRPDSPSGIKRPFSPGVKAHSPLVGAFDELAVLPSPHLLRKSGTFTSLDFAPPKFAGQYGDTASDAGSIRSARSGISAMQMNAVRAGAYRVSRIPKEMVTTKEDLASQLRPKMDLISRV